MVCLFFFFLSLGWLLGKWARIVGWVGMESQCRSSLGETEALRALVNGFQQTGAKLVERFIDRQIQLIEAVSVWKETETELVQHNYIKDFNSKRDIVVLRAGFHSTLTTCEPTATVRWTDRRDGSGTSGCRSCPRAPQSPAAAPWTCR